jgi:pimeloyl-ACP methyl ester carboxylesterase
MVTFTPADSAASSLSLDVVRLSNGVALHYASQGPRTGPAVILVHGYSDSWFSFSRVLPLLPSELRVIAPDMRGHGDSERPAAGYRIADMADDVVRLMDALNVPKAVLIGHSMGSFVVRKAFELAPERVSRLVLIGGALRANNAGVRELQRSVNALTDPVDETFVREFQLSTIAAPVPEPFLEAVIANSRRMPARIWQAVLQGLIEFEPGVVRPAVRTLVLGGREDAVFSSTEQMVLARQFPRGELHLVDGIGHTLHWEQPAMFVSALTRFGV